MQVDNYEPPTKRPRTNRQTTLPNPQLYRDDTGAMKLKGMTLTLLGQGEFHKAWRIEGNNSRLIKTLSPLLNNRKKIECVTETLRVQNALAQRTDVKVARIFNNIWEDGYYEVEYIPNEVTDFNKIKELLANMVKNPATSYIEDFVPRNVRQDDEGNIVIIDPAHQSFDLEDENELRMLAIHVSQIYQGWFENNAAEVLQEIDRSTLSERSQFIYDFVLKQLPGNFPFTKKTNPFMC